MFKSKGFIFIFAILSCSAFASEPIYKEMKGKIENLENAMIQEFSIDLPQNEDERFSEDYSKAATQLAVKYAIQKKLFYKIEEQFINLNKSIDKHIVENELTEEEASKLRTGIEYATRIIMNSRMTEIHEIYEELKTSLMHGPKLSEVYLQLQKMNSHNCSMENLKFDQDSKQLSFKVKKKNKFGSWTMASFTITNKDIQAGRLLSMPDISQANFPYNRFITNFWTSKQMSNDQKFSLHLDHFGSIVAAEFMEKAEEPLVEVLGIKIGRQTIDKHIDCETSVRIPANTKD